MSDTNLDRFIHYGTNAQRLAFTPSPASGTQPIYIWYESDTNNIYFYTTAWHGPFSSTTGTIVYPSRCEGRLTLESGVPVSTTDQTAKSTLYWTPCVDLVSVTNGVISLWDGAQLVDVSITQKSLSLSSLTSGKNYDVFIDYNSGTPQIVLSAAWTNDSTRADALSSQYDSTRKETIVVKSGTSAYRWVGIIRTTGTTTTEDSLTKRFVYNAYNQTLRSASNTVLTDETTTSSSYTDLSTAGPTISFVYLAGTLIVHYSSMLQNFAGGNSGWTSVDVSGATTTAGTDDNALQITNINAGVGFQGGRAVPLALTAGYNSIKLVYRRDGGTFHFLRRFISAEVMY